MAERPKPRRSPRAGKRQRPAGGGNRRRSTPGAASRRLAIDALVRIENGGAYANLVLPEMLDRSTLSAEDRHFVTELVYGTTRMRRACDHLVDRFLLDGDVEPQVRAALRVGAYQLAFLGTPPHAALDATVGAVSGRGRSVVNAVLRRVSKAPVEFPDEATEWSYPDWVVERFKTDLGPARAKAALLAMNERATTTRRDDGYVQDPASQLVVEALDVAPGHLVVDLCAAPGGKATGAAAAGGRVIAADLRQGRVRLIADNVRRLDAEVTCVVADGLHPPLRSGVADRVLVDAPCSGLGSLRRRPDARWRIDAAGPDRLAELQAELVMAAWPLVAPGGMLIYSVCTLTEAEGAGVLRAVLARLDRSDVEVVGPPSGPWTVGDDGVAMLEPLDSDAMTMFRLRRPGRGDGVGVGDDHV